MVVSVGITPIVIPSSQTACVLPLALTRSIMHNARCARAPTTNTVAIATLRGRLLVHAIILPVRNIEYRTHQNACFPDNFEWHWLAVHDSLQIFPSLRDRMSKSLGYRCLLCEVSLSWYTSCAQYSRNGLHAPPTPPISSPLHPSPLHL